MNRIEVFNETNDEIKEIEQIKEVLRIALSVEELDHIEMNVILVDDEKIHDINKRYRKIDRPTDVISFALEDDETSKIDVYDYRVLGDIYISVETARRQAVYYGPSFLREITFLTVHGFYHLLGYDHQNPKEEEEMIKKQNVVMHRFERKKVYKKALDRKRLRDSFSHAFDGLIDAYHSEGNLVVHSLVALLVIICGLIIGLSNYEWIICLLLFGLVITAELLNTTFEHMVDLACPEINPLAKKVKDTAAASVLVFAFVSAIIGLMIFVPKIVIILKAKGVL